MAAPRFTAPEHLEGATEFSKDHLVGDPLWLVRTLKQTYWLWRDLDQATVFDKSWGRRRDTSQKWVLAFLAFTISDSIDVQPWWSGTTPDLWRECGFPDKPALKTVYQRFVELETDGADAIVEAAGALMRHARKHEPRIGRHLHIDSCEAETHAALVHDCAPGECPDELKQASTKKSGRSYKRRGSHMLERRSAQRPSRVSSERAKEDRQAENNLSPEEAEKAMRDIAELAVQNGHARIKTKAGHWYRTLDKTAGIRAYTGPRGATRFWHGFYNTKVIDHYTGAPLAVTVESCSRQEYQIYPEIYRQLERNLGHDWRPETMVADKGFSVASVFEHNTRRNIATVAPWRAGGGGDGWRHDFYELDRHGIPRCKHCGAPSRFVRFSAQPQPRLWFDCSLGHTPACRKTQTIACSKNWRLLTPLWRTDALYHELKASHERYERVHDHWRDRYRVGGPNVGTRPKRIGKGWQQLRANAALLVEWFRICFREGWLGTARRNKKEPERIDADGIRIRDQVLRFRRRIGLHRPYGEKADALGLGELLPPSRRAAANKKAADAAAKAAKNGAGAGGGSSGSPP